MSLRGQEIASLCKKLIPDEHDQVLLNRLQSLLPDAPVSLARTGDKWYRLGGVVDRETNRVASDVNEWTERTFLECGQNLQTLIDYALDEQLIATRQIGHTLYYVAQTGPQAEDFVLFEIDKTHEVSDRLLINEDALPEDLEDIIDPLEPASIQSSHIGHFRYQYRRKTDIALFLETINLHHKEEHPVQRFVEDWNRSSAAESVFCKDWIIRPYQHVGRYGEQIINAEIINVQQKQLPHLEDLVSKKGDNLNNLLMRFDRQAGYPFAWFFYMVKGKLVSPHNAEAVYQDITGDFSYLPKRDEAVLRDWISSPYNL